MIGRFAICLSLATAAGCTQVFGLDSPERAIPPDADLRQHSGFVIDRVLLPRNNSEALTHGLDVDGDGVVDNQLGRVFSTLGSMGADVQAPTDDMVDDGTSIMLVDVLANQLTSASAEVTIVFGVNPVPAACASAQDLVCRRHLTGTGTFGVSPVFARPPALQGTIDDAGVLLAGPGAFSVAISVGGTMAVILPLVGARVRLDLRTNGFGSGTTRPPTAFLAGAVRESDLVATVYVSLAAEYNTVIAADCTALNMPPGCGCDPSSTGKTVQGLFDVAPKDCQVTATEIATNSLVQSLFEPDVLIDGVRALSIGMGVDGVGAIFELD